ncbi:hypothetical protein FRC17_005596 [Serendipita sp. 399]|nr:hypothetical protein FRC17_005596 [Serendipita sp. 399]
MDPYTLNRSIGEASKGETLARQQRKNAESQKLYRMRKKEQERQRDEEIMNLREQLTKSKEKATMRERELQFYLNRDGKGKDYSNDLLADLLISSMYERGEPGEFFPPRRAIISPYTATTTTATTRTTSTASNLPSTSPISQTVGGGDKQPQRDAASKPVPSRSSGQDREGGRSDQHTRPM